ncbi:class II fructose-bisphosphate aldolase [Streptomyces sp. JJ36]|uniref:class II fructose-bisphosphate aldolase n=1 Tax=Streptomyces sp. JJ36 TaxID=2736645 RepID=UPI001F3B9F41|nr:class II fructose-bisphosphate aldolase [Streptomyces sp. JJ36]MCF6523767.1 class II fructose-bisphosphate aldolase [Streptomyces sp. JJ36]
MPVAASGDLITRARDARRGIAAFNIVTLEQAEAVATAAEGAGLPVILQISQNAVRFHHDRPAGLVAAATAVAEAAAVPVALHLDHVESTGLLRSAAGTAVSSVMFDASRLPYRENVRETARAAEWAHAHGLWLEAELGEIGGKDGAHAPGARTDPAEAARFVGGTGVDALAVAVGSSHAMTERTARLDHRLIGALRRALPVPLVLHGSSGVPDGELRAAVEAGMVKVNIGTALGIAFTGAVRDRLAADPAVVDPRRYLAEARAAVARTAEHLLRVVAGAAG